MPTTDSLENRVLAELFVHISRVKSPAALAQGLRALKAAPPSQLQSDPEDGDTHRAAGDRGRTQVSRTQLGARRGSQVCPQASCYQLFLPLYPSFCHSCSSPGHLHPWLLVGWWVSCRAGAVLGQSWQGHNEAGQCSGASGLSSCLPACPWAFDWLVGGPGMTLGAAGTFGGPPFCPCHSVLLVGCANELYHITQQQVLQTVGGHP